MSERKKFWDYLMFAAIGIVLLLLLPPVLTPIFGFMGVYATYAVTGVTLMILLWVYVRAKKAVV